MNGPAGVTLTANSGQPYRPDGDGIIYVLAGDVAELSQRGYTPATTGDLAALDDQAGSLTVVSNDG